MEMIQLTSETKRGLSTLVSCLTLCYPYHHSPVLPTMCLIMFLDQSHMGEVRSHLCYFPCGSISSCMIGFGLLSLVWTLQTLMDLGVVAIQGCSATWVSRPCELSRALCQSLTWFQHLLPFCPSSLEKSGPIVMGRFSALPRGSDHHFLYYSKHDFYHINLKNQSRELGEYIYIVRKEQILTRNPCSQSPFFFTFCINDFVLKLTSSMGAKFYEHNLLIFPSVLNANNG